MTYYNYYMTCTSQFPKMATDVPMRRWMMIFFLIFSANSYAQTQLSKVIPASPVAMELTKYINYPVNLSNGLVQISIPLYEINEGDIKLPITLNYHASGLKPNVRSGSWLGDGWSLNTGPSLSRSINGGVDELYYWNFDNDMLPSYFQMQQVVEQKKDIALDEFNYSLLNNSGRLYFKRMANNQLRPVFIPVSPVKVNLPNVNDYTNVINLTDAMGFQYSFGGSESKYKDYVYHTYGSSVSQVPTAWKIKSIFSPLSNRSISFEYADNITEVPFYRMTDKVVMLDNISCQCTDKIPLIQVDDVGMNPKYYNYDLTAQQLQLVDVYNVTLPTGYSFPQRSTETITQFNSYINKISFSGGYILVTKNEGGRPGLTSIRVYNYQNTLVKQIELIQAVSGYAAMQLSEVRISSPYSTEIQKYSFQYNGVMSKDTRSLDKWGFYNAAPNTTLVPSITTSVQVNNFPYPGEQKDISIPGGDREPNESAMQQGMLTEIKYPTGGRTRFIYEAHRYKDELGRIRLAGGLRIKQIQQVDDAGQKLYRNFNYSVNGNYNGGKTFKFNC